MSFEWNGDGGDGDGDDTTEYDVAGVDDGGGGGADGGDGDDGGGDTAGDGAAAANESESFDWAIAAYGAVNRFKTVAPVTALSFDPTEEVVWAGTNEGRIVCLYGTPPPADAEDSAIPELTKLAAFAAHTSGVIKLWSSADGAGVLSVASGGVRFHSRGGLMLQQFRVNESGDRKDAKSAEIDTFIRTATATSNPNRAEIVLSYTRPALALYDIATNSITKTLSVSEEVAAIASSNRLLCCGGVAGTIELRDTRSWRSEHRFTVSSKSANASGALSIAELDCKGDVLLATAYAPTSALCERSVTAFDLRTLRALPAIPFDGGSGAGVKATSNAGACWIRFMPKFSSTFVVSSTIGRFQIRDSRAGAEEALTAPVYHVSSHSQHITALAVSSTGQSLAFGDSDGYVQVWTDRPHATINAYSQPTEVVEPFPVPAYSLDENRSFAAYGPMAETLSAAAATAAAATGSDSVPLSEWSDLYNGQSTKRAAATAFRAPTTLSLDTQTSSGSSGGLSPLSAAAAAHSAHTLGSNRPRRSKPMPPIDSSLIADLKLTDFIGTAPRPNASIKRNHKASFRKFTAQRTLTEKTANKLNKRHFQWSASPQRRAAIKKEYARVSIKIPQLLYSSFDFSSFNPTQFTGLDNLLPNSYCNAILQAFYFIPAIRAFMLNHICPKDNCLSCQIGFLFHMLDHAKGNSTEPRNFLRVLRQIPEAGALGLLDPVQPSDELLLAVKIQDFHRFLLEHLNKEAQTDLNERRERIAKQQHALALAAAATGQSQSQSQPQLLSSHASGSAGAAAAAPPPERIQVPFQQQFSPLRGAQPQPYQQYILPTALPAPATTTSVADSATASGSSEQKQSTAPPPAPAAASIDPSSINIVESLFGAKVEHRTNCLGGKHESIRQATALYFKLSYPTTRKFETFPNLLANTLCEESTRRVWCELCGKYEISRHTRTLKSLPNILSVHANVNTDLELDLWRSQAADGYTASDVAQNESASGSAAGTTSGGRFITRSAASAMNAWLPLLIQIEIDPTSASSKPKVTRFQPTPKPAAPAPAQPLADSKSDSKSGDATTTSTTPAAAAAPKREVGGLNLPPNAAVYQLSCVIAHVSDPASAENTATHSTINGEHLVAHIHVPHSKVYGDNLCADRFYVFNDFVISASTARESVRFSYEWKQPCLLTYTRIDLASRVPVPAERNPILGAVYWNAPNIAALNSKRNNAHNHTPLPPRSFTPLFKDEQIGKDSVVSLDCEFVAVAAEESEVKSDGTKIVTKPSRLQLARVSVLRGTGAMAGVPFIDDFILTSEPVVDYLTRYSGIQPGDLDRAVSTHHLTTLKSAYVRLRSLVDRGCKFVGHGLTKDFQMINMVVPPSQVCDTSDLFHLAGQRKLSLRFLALHVLGHSIQADTHDSIEDARTALALYTRHQQLVSAGARLLETTIRQLYQVGAITNFSITTPTPPLPAPSPPIGSGASSNPNAASAPRTSIPHSNSYPTLSATAASTTATATGSTSGAVAAVPPVRKH